MAAGAVGRSLGALSISGEGGARRAVSTRQHPCHARPGRDLDEWRLFLLLDERPTRTQDVASLCVVGFPFRSVHKGRPPGAPRDNGRTSTKGSVVCTGGSLAIPRVRRRVRVVLATFPRAPARRGVFDASLRTGARARSGCPPLIAPRLPRIVYVEMHSPRKLGICANNTVLLRRGI